MAKIRVSKTSIPLGDPEDKIRITPLKTPIDERADIRDVIASIVTRRQMGLRGDAGGGYLRMKQVLGDEKAQKLINHLFVYNSRPELGQMSPEQRLNNFYSTSVTDPELEKIVNGAKNFGYGVLPGFRESNQEINQVVGNRLDLTKGDPLATEKIKVRVANKTQ